MQFKCGIIADSRDPLMAKKEAISAQVRRTAIKVKFSNRLSVK